MRTFDQLDYNFQSMEKNIKELEDQLTHEIEIMSAENYDPVIRGKSSLMEVDF